MCYIFSKFACKIQIQSFSFAFPIILTVPLSITILIIMSGLYELNVCMFHDFLPDYIFFQSIPMHHLTDFIAESYLWVWLLAIFSQIWITRHIWYPKNDRNASTEKLFVAPMYCGLLIDQGLVLNRQREDQYESIKKSVSINVIYVL